MKLSEYGDRRVYHDYDGNPNIVNFKCRINDTYVMVTLDKLNGRWRFHYVAHAEETCEYCGEVNLYSNCWRFTDLVRDHYEEIMSWAREQQKSAEPR